MTNDDILLELREFKRHLTTHVVKKSEVVAWVDQMIDRLVEAKTPIRESRKPIRRYLTDVTYIFNPNTRVGHYHLKLVAHYRDNTSADEHINFTESDIFKGKLNTFVLKVYQPSSERYLKTFINNMIEGTIQAKYFYFRGAKFFAINVEGVEGSRNRKIRPYTYWFPIEYLYRLNFIQRQELDRRKGYPFISP